MRNHDCIVISRTAEIGLKLVVSEFSETQVSRQIEALSFRIRVHFGPIYRPDRDIDVSVRALSDRSGYYAKSPYKSAD